MRIRFQADADLSQIIVKAVLRREPEIDFQTATEANLAGKNDDEVLTISSKEKRILVTHDQRTIPGHFARFTMNQTSSGVILISQKMPVVEAVEDLIMIWSLTGSDEWINRIVKLPL